MKLEPAAWRALQAALDDLGHPAVLGQAGGHVGDGHEALALGELDDQLILLAPAAEAMRVSVSAGRSGRERCVPAAQSRRMPERALGLLLISGGWWVGLGSKAAQS